MIALRSPERRLARQLWLARAALAWERLWPALWPLVAIVAAFAVVALFDLPALLPGWLHTALLAAFGLAAAAAAIAAGRGLAWPGRDVARRRVERASGLDHRPLAALTDRPSAPLDPAAAGLWEAHRRRMAGLVRRLRVGWPAGGLARRDPWGMRAVLALLLLLAVIDAGADWRDRLVRSLTPAASGAAAVAAASFDMWITPPEYTGLPPQFLRAAAPPAGDGPIRVPVGSALLAQIHGGSGVPRLAVDGAAREFAVIDRDNFRAEETLTKGHSLEVRQGGTVLGHWAIAIIPDEPPAAAFAEPPHGTARAALKLDYKASDDYGVESLKAVIGRDGGNPGETVEIELPLPGLHLKEATGASYQDLSPHPWAGLPVEIRLRATDAIGQTGDSEPVRMTLPERTFNHPIARAIIDQRKELVRDPGSREAIAEILGDLNKRPALYRNDIAVFLALRLASLQLQRGEPKAAIDAVVPLLWDAALRVEDGNMSLAEREVRRLQQALQDALARNAPDAEIEQLMRDLRQALDQYLQALAEDAQRHPGRESGPVDPSKVVTPRDLQRMIDRARDLARSGAQQQARELLSQLQDMLENMRTARPGEAQRHGPNQAQQMMRGLQQMQQQQQQLLDRSFRAQRQQDQGARPGPLQRGPGNQDPGQMGDMAEMSDEANQQEALRHMLGEIMRGVGDGLGDIPEPMARAERSMRDASGALQRGEPGGAIAPQTEALDQLQQAARDIAKAMRKQSGNSSGEPGDENGDTTGRDGRENADRDPFGRPLSSSGPYDRGDVEIPDVSVLQRSRQILDELRRRAGERSRPAIELDYIDRLLRRF